MSRTQTLRSLISSIPATPLRPTGSPQLSNALESILGRAEKSAAGESVAQGMAASLERLQAGEALRRYPLSSRTLQPSHDLQFYTRIKDGVHRSAQGKGRSWWKSFFQLKGDA